MDFECEGLALHWSRISDLVVYLPTA